MEYTGWITLHRKLLDDSSSFRCLNLAQFFIAIQILLRANHSTREIIHRKTGEKFKIERGSLLVSQSGILDWFTPETRPDRQVVRTALKRLEKIGFINQTTNQGLTILNVVNYSVYQTPSPQPNQPVIHELTSTKPDPNQHLTTNNNDNNVNNENKVSIGVAKSPARKTESPSEKFKLFWDAYPKKVEKVDCVKVWKDKKLDNQFDEIMAGLERYKQSGYVLDDGGKWTKAPHRWLEKERWTDIDLPLPKGAYKPAGDIAPLAYPPSDPRHPNHSEYDPAYDTTAKADLRRAARGEGDPRDYLIWAIEKYYPGKMAELGYVITTEPDNPKCRFYERGPNFKPLVTP